MQIENIMVLIADDGKTLKRIADGEILGSKLSLGVNDDINNYIEIDSSILENMD